MMPLWLLSILTYLNVATPLQVETWRARKLASNERAEFNVSGLLSVVFLVLGAILGAVLGMKLIAALLPTYSDATSTIVTTLNTTDWGDQTTNEISPIFALVVGISALLAIVALVFLVVTVVKRRA